MCQSRGVRETWEVASALQPTALIPVGRYGHAAVVLPGIRMFIFGGIGDSNHFFDDLWYLYMDPGWEGLPPPSPVTDTLGDHSGIVTEKKSDRVGDSPAPAQDEWKKAHQRLMKEMDTLKERVTEEEATRTSLQGKLEVLEEEAPSRKDLASRVEALRHKMTSLKKGDSKEYVKSLNYK